MPHNLVYCVSQKNKGPKITYNYGAMFYSLDFGALTNLTMYLIVLFTVYPRKIGPENAYNHGLCFIH